MERIVKEKEKKKGVGKERRTDGRRKKKNKYERGARKEKAGKGRE